jgi:hypothetical protein
VSAKPTVEELGIDPDAQEWQRSGDGAGAIEITFTRLAPGASPASAAHEPGRGSVDGPGQGQGQEPGLGEDWVLMRVAGDPDRRVLVFDRNEWECFLDGVRKGEFDDAADNDAP